MSWFLLTKTLTLLLLSGGFIILKQERTSTDEKSIANNHCYHITTKFKKNKNKFLSYIIYLNLTKDLIKHVSLQMVVHARL